jgi:hypothetical protein
LKNRTSGAANTLQKLKDSTENLKKENETMKLVDKLHNLESQIKARENPNKNDPFGIYKKRVDNNPALKFLGLTPKQRLKKRAEELAKKIEKRLKNENEK